MSMISICVFCGEEKQHPGDVCSTCKNEPTKKSDEINSLILSFDTSSNENYLSLEMIKSYSLQIKNGDKFCFDEDVIKRATEDFDLMNEVNTKSLVIFLLKFSWPIFPLLAIIYFTLLR